MQYTFNYNLEKKKRNIAIIKISAEAFFHLICANSVFIDKLLYLEINNKKLKKIPKDLKLCGVYVDQHNGSINLIVESNKFPEYLEGGMPIELHIIRKRTTK